ncbi:hypothetical protein E8E14_008999 [Neopestalotiopsis sp. 37M]|nr:hypothetical protein E8E14_008999 [Neopestalotiopsis sp. 37M]
MNISVAHTANELLHAILQSPGATVGDILSGSGDAIHTAERRPITDPDKLKFLREIIALLLNGRKICASFNLTVLATLAILTAIRWLQKFRNGRQVKRLVKETKDATKTSPQAPDKANNHDRRLFVEASRDETPSSSSSSLRTGSRSPREAVKAENHDLERQPLLGRQLPTRAPLGIWRKITCRIRSWLMYQPRPIPIINRNLPSNGTTLFVLGYIGANIFHHLYGGSFKPEMEFVFADRAGCMFIVNMPLLYLLAAKNQPIKFLTGYSYEALNIFHRRVGEWMCFEALVHSLGMLLDHLFFTVDWLKEGDIWFFLRHPLVLLGIGAFVSYELLFFTSLGSFRQRWYETFLALHVVLQIVALVFLYLHFWTARPYVLACLIIFLADRLIWRLGLKSTSLQADVRVLEDGNTLMLSANWDIFKTKRTLFCRVFGPSIIQGWRPMDHVFITAPSLGRTHRLQAHPFTIASAAPGVPSKGDGNPFHAWLALLVRAQDGFTRDLLHYAQSNPTIKLRVDGPYGSTDALEMFLTSEVSVLIAGGSGIAVVFPLVWELVHKQDHIFPRRQIHLLWVVHSGSHRSWMPQDRIDDLKRAGVHVTIPPPTIEAGRPDVNSYVADLAERSSQSGAEMGVVVSGPDAMNRTARNACASAVGRGHDVKLSVEKFGW